MIRALRSQTKSNDKYMYLGVRISQDKASLLEFIKFAVLKQDEFDCPIFNKFVVINVRDFDHIVKLLKSISHEH